MEAKSGKKKPKRKNTPPGTQLAPSQTKVIRKA